MSEHNAVNQSMWDELAPLHAASAFYDLESFRRSGDTLGEVEIAEVGDVGGKRLLHLMCHIGLDTLSWARRGALVTGLDFSAEALGIASRLADEAGLEAEFVQSDVMAAGRLRTRYDIVFTSKGVLTWIEDIAGWAEVCAGLLEPGGVFYLLDFHPLTLALARTTDGLALHGDYFHRPEPAVVVADGSYAVSDAGLTHQESREWNHSLGEVVSALIAAGIRIEFVHEFPAVEERPSATAGAGGTLGPRLPGTFSIRGVRA